MTGPISPAVNGNELAEVLKPILYADIFDFPLTFEEIYRFLEVPAAPERVRDWLDGAVAGGQVIRVGDYYSLAGKPHLATRRGERQAAARLLWPKAVGYGHWIASLPFVRMVAVTGSLAVDNPRDGRDDIDYLVITGPRRLWLCRALIVLLVRYGHLQGVHLCPNYLLTENTLYLEENNLFAAREMLQMMPVYGTGLYLKMWELNTWVFQHLPQRHQPNTGRLDDTLLPFQAWLKRAGEWLLGGRLGDTLETLAQQFQINKHTRRAAQSDLKDRVVFTAEVCKGHYDGHNSRIMSAFRERLRAVQPEEHFELKVAAGE